MTSQADAMPEIMQALEVRGPMQIDRPRNELELLALALQSKSGIDIIERLAALQEKARDKEAEIQFNDAMNLAQAELGRVAPDLTNPQTHSRYASYAALDKKIRPIYTKHGFSLSFNTDDSQPETVKVVCYVSHRGGHTRSYMTVMPADGKGAKGGDVMTKTHATGAAMSYGMRYLLKMIFNIAIGEEDNDGNGGGKMDEFTLRDFIDSISQSSSLAELKARYDEAYDAAKKVKDYEAVTAIVAAKDAKKKVLR